MGRMQNARIESDVCQIQLLDPALSVATLPTFFPLSIQFHPLQTPIAKWLPLAFPAIGVQQWKCNSKHPILKPRWASASPKHQPRGATKVV